MSFETRRLVRTHPQQPRTPSVRRQQRPRQGPAGTRKAILLVAIVALAAPACDGGGGGGITEQAGSPSATTTSPSASVTTSHSPSPPPATGGRYEGPEVAFDLPTGWHEFYLEVDMDFSAAYGPVSGGDDDYVMIAPLPARSKKVSPEEILASMPSAAGPVERVDANGIPGYSVPMAVTGSHGQALEGNLILVRGKSADYVVVCQYGKHMKDLVSVGCESLKESLVEVPKPTITDPSGCTDVELPLLQSVPMPDGTHPRKAGGQVNEDGRYCDQMFMHAPRSVGFREDLVGYFRAALADAGWHGERAEINRTSAPFTVWQVLAFRDWDVFMVEIYVDTEGVAVAKGAAANFFVTVSDG